MKKASILLIVGFLSLLNIQAMSQFPKIGAKQFIGTKGFTPGSFTKVTGYKTFKPHERCFASSQEIENLLNKALEKRSVPGVHNALVSLKDLKPSEIFSITENKLSYIKSQLASEISDLTQNRQKAQNLLNQFEENLSSMKKIEQYKTIQAFKRFQPIIQKNEEDIAHLEKIKIMIQDVEDQVINKELEGAITFTNILKEATKWSTSMQSSAREPRVFEEAVMEPAYEGFAGLD